jgi:hypothetical protein
LAGVPELPPAPWQAAQTAVKRVSPAAASGLPVATAATAFGAWGDGVAAAGPGVAAAFGAAGIAGSPEAAGAVALAAAALASTAGWAGCWARVVNAEAARTTANSREAGDLITVLEFVRRKTS